MAPLRNLQLYQGIVNGTTLAIVYTVPSGHRVVLKRATVRNLASVTNSLYLYEGTAVVLRSWSLAAGAPGAGQDDWSTWIVIDENETLRMRITNTSGVAVVLSGSIYFI